MFIGVTKKRFIYAILIHSYVYCNYYLNHVEGHLLHPYGLLPFRASCSVATCFDKRFRVLASKSGQYFYIYGIDIDQEITQ